MFFFKKKSSIDKDFGFIDHKWTLKKLNLLKVYSKPNSSAGDFGTVKKKIDFLGIKDLDSLY